MFEIIIASTAKQDIKNTLSYIKDTLCNHKAAIELADMIQEEISSLSMFPFSGTPVIDSFLSDYGFRFLLIKNYKVYYITDKENKKVNIIRFLHATRDSESILKGEV